MSPPVRVATPGWAAVALARGAALVLGAVALPGCHAADPAREAARGHYEQGMEALARLDGDGVFASMRAAWEADPTYLPALVEGLLHLQNGAMLTSERWAAVEALAEGGDGDVRLCAAVILASGSGAPAPPVPPRGAGTTPTPCTRLSAIWGGEIRDDPAQAAEDARVLSGMFPESPALLDWRLRALAAAGGWEAVLEEADPGRVGTSPFLQAVAAVNRGAALHALGRHAEAARLEAEAEAAARSAGPGVLYRQQASLHVHSEAYARGELVAHLDSAEVRRSAISETLGAAADPAFRMYLGFNAADQLLSIGHLSESLDRWDGLILLADSLGLPGWQAEMRLRRGRTLVKMGRQDEAERSLLEARPFAAASPLRRPAYEVEHNVLHLYESRGRAAEARAAGEAFVALTRRAGDRPVRMIAYRDLGWLLRREGNRAGGDALLDAMVALIDTLGDYHYYAGEYAELNGDLDLAARHYRRQSPATQDGTKAMAGLVRVAEAVGDTASALERARAHDDRLLARDPEGRPLLPGVLARAGRHEEARRGLEEARARALGRGQVAAWARLTLEAAELASATGWSEAAASLADSAGEAAERVGDADTAARARTRAALEKGRNGGGAAASALVRIRGERARVHAGGMPELESDLWFAEGEVLSVLGRDTEADEALSRAWALSEAVARDLSLDVRRAAYQASRNRIAEAGLRLAAQRDGRDALDRWLAWSQRKRGAAAELDAPVGTVALERSLAPDEALVDFAFLPDRLMALVASRRGSRVVALEADPGSVAADVGRLLSGLTPRIGTQVDLGRSRLDRAAAHRLYLALVAPLEPLLEGVDRLVVLPDGPLHRLPFDALVAGSATGGGSTWLVERYRMRVAVVPVPEAPETGGWVRRLLAVAGPAPTVGAGSGAASETVQETAAVARAYGAERSTLLDGPAATSRALRLDAPGHAVVHLAAHARPNEREPQRGYVALAESDGNGGRMYAYEIDGMELHGALVVLSGCDTWNGRVLAGEGVLSLGRAFLRAGADGVVATLWPVGAPTIPLMERFYRALARGADPESALWEAKRWAAAAGGEPVLWAPLVLVRRGV